MSVRERPTYGCVLGGHDAIADKDRRHATLQKGSATRPGQGMQGQRGHGQQRQGNRTREVEGEKVGHYDGVLLPRAVAVARSNNWFVPVIGYWFYTNQTMLGSGIKINATSQVGPIKRRGRNGDGHAKYLAKSNQLRLWLS